MGSGIYVSRTVEHNILLLPPDVANVKYHFRNENVVVSFNTFQVNDNKLVSLNIMYII
jgi:hypothetical protein